MILYLYALADIIDGVEGVTGVCGEAPVVMPLPACMLVAGWIEQRPAIDRESLTRQDALVRRIHAVAPAVLPMRFGTSVADVEAAGRAVEAFGPAIREQFALVRDREQMTLRVTTSGGSSASAVSGGSGASGPSREGAGRRYLEGRAAQRMPDEMKRLVQSIEPLQRAVRVESGHRSGMTTVYHLIDRGRAADYVQAATRAAHDQPSVTLRISGPSPAYAFADLGRLR